MLIYIRFFRGLLIQLFHQISSKKMAPLRKMTRVELKKHELKLKEGELEKQRLALEVTIAAKELKVAETEIKVIQMVSLKL